MAISWSLPRTTQDTDTFHLFSKLPTELRLKIWNFNLPHTRLVPIRCGSNSPSHSADRGSLSWTSGCTSPAVIPANLHVCSEARAETLKHYNLQFGFARGPGQVFFNPVRDIVYFGPRDGYMASDSQFHTYMSMCDPAELAPVRRIAINDALFWIDNTYRSMTAASLTVEILRRIQSRMPGVQEIIFVPRDEESMTGPDAAYIEPTMVHVRMARQIQTAVATLVEQTPQWNPPRWRILPLSAFPSPYA
ncbi:Fc.00g076400.m01.CDS01 [Cosmosporella sp. VM-42]